MGSNGLLGRLRELLGSVAWRVFLWANRTTAEQYWDDIWRQESARAIKGERPAILPPEQGRIETWLASAKLCFCGEVCELSKMRDCRICRTKPMCDDCHAEHVLMHEAMNTEER